MKKIESILGEKLRKLREEKGLTQLELARIFNIDKQRISKYELGQRQMDDQTKILFANYFNVTIDYLLGRTDNPNPISQPSMSTQDLNVVENFKKLSDEDRELVEAIIRMRKKQESAGQND